MFPKSISVISSKILITIKIKEIFYKKNKILKNIYILQTFGKLA